MSEWGRRLVETTGDVRASSFRIPTDFRCGGETYEFGFAAR